MVRGGNLLKNELRGEYIQEKTYVNHVPPHDFFAAEVSESKASYVNHVPPHEGFAAEVV